MRYGVLIIGAENLSTWLASGAPYSGKVVFNGVGAIIFPATRQHRDMKADGVSYEDDYKGNALAAMLTPGNLEIRFHKAFSDATVTQIVATMLVQPGLEVMRHWRITYQGRNLHIPESA